MLAADGTIQTLEFGLCEEGKMEERGERREWGGGRDTQSMSGQHGNSTGTRGG